MIRQLLALYTCIINDFLSISNHIYEMYLHKLRNNYPSKTSSDLFNNGFKHDIVKTYFLKLILFFCTIQVINMGVNNQVAFHSVLFFFLHCPASRNVLVANQSWNSNKIQSLKELCTTKASNCIRKLSIELLLVNCLSFVIPKPVDKRTCRREFHTMGYFDTLFFSIVLVRDRCLHCTSCSKQNNWSLQQENNEI